jgi:hypothetical protein
VASARSRTWSPTAGSKSGHAAASLCSLNCRSARSALPPSRWRTCPATTSAPRQPGYAPCSPKPTAGTPQEVTTEIIYTIECQLTSAQAKPMLEGPWHAADSPWAVVTRATAPPRQRAPPDAPTISRPPSLRVVQPQSAQRDALSDQAERASSYCSCCRATTTDLGRRGRYSYHYMPCGPTWHTHDHDQQVA